MANLQPLARWRTIFSVVFLLVLAGCSNGYLPPPVSPQMLESRSHASASQLRLGYTIHQIKCAKCHTFLNPADYSTEELLSEIMPSMTQQSKLNPRDAAAVTAYILAARKMSPSSDKP